MAQARKRRGMIAADQPTSFPDSVLVRISSRQDGTLLDRTNGARHEPEVVARRKAFCELAGIDYDRSVYLIITYDEDRTYDIITDVRTPNTEGVYTDVLYTETRDLPLFLPVADCIGMVIYDSRRQALALAHIGRHASEADTLAKTINFFAEKGSRPEDIIIWMAPAVKKEHYRMEYFGKKDDPLWREYCEVKRDGIYLDLQGYNYSRAIDVGVVAEHITISPVDTAIDSNYFSHSQGDTAGRFAVVAMLEA